MPKNFYVRIYLNEKSTEGERANIDVVYPSRRAAYKAYHSIARQMKHYNAISLPSHCVAVPLWNVHSVMIVK